MCVLYAKNFICRHYKVIFPNVSAATKYGSTAACRRRWTSANHSTAFASFHDDGRLKWPPHAICPHAPSSDNDPVTSWNSLWWVLECFVKALTEVESQNFVCKNVKTKFFSFFGVFCHLECNLVTVVAFLYNHVKYIYWIELVLWDMTQTECLISLV